ncbi:hypothetical protein FACS189493_5110 [Spirochaetia bacterium]|nr:hypothetical protein FACS189493_5110 [Spirochaetia bacterium]
MNQAAKKGRKPTKKNIVLPAGSAADMLEEFGIANEAIIEKMKDLAFDPEAPNGAMLRHLQKAKAKPSDRVSEVKLRVQEAHAEKIELANAEKRGELISRAIAETYISDFYSAHTSILLPIGLKIIDSLAAVAKVQDVGVKLKMQEMIDDELYSFLETIEKTTNSFLKRYGSGQAEPPPPPGGA